MSLLIVINYFIIIIYSKWALSWEILFLFYANQPVQSDQPNDRLVHWIICRNPGALGIISMSVFVSLVSLLDGIPIFELNIVPFQKFTTLLQIK